MGVMHSQYPLTRSYIDILFRSCWSARQSVGVYVSFKSSCSENNYDGLRRYREELI